MVLEIFTSSWNHTLIIGFINAISSEYGGNHCLLQIRVATFSVNYYHFLGKIMERFLDGFSAGLNSE